MKMWGVKIGEKIVVQKLDFTQVEYLAIFLFVDQDSGQIGSCYQVNYPSALSPVITVGCTIRNTHMLQAIVLGENNGCFKE